MLFKLHQIRCNFPAISYLSETQKNKLSILKCTTNQTVNSLSVSNNVVLSLSATYQTML